MSTFQPPPTWANPVLVDETSNQGSFNPIWLKWFVDLVGVLNSLGAGGTSIDHNTLLNLEGGGGTYYHLTLTQHTALTAGFTGTGNLVRQTTPTLVTPVLGAATGTSVIVTSTLQSTLAGGLKSSDGTGGTTGTVNTMYPGGYTLTFKDGLLVGIA